MLSCRKDDRKKSNCSSYLLQYIQTCIFFFALVVFWNFSGNLYLHKGSLICELFLRQCFQRFPDHCQGGLAQVHGILQNPPPGQRCVYVTITQSMGRWDSSWALQGMVLDPTALSQALLSMDGWWIFVLGIEGQIWGIFVLLMALNFSFQLLYFSMLEGPFYYFKNIFHFPLNPRAQL